MVAGCCAGPGWPCGAMVACCRIEATVCGVDFLFLPVRVNPLAALGA